eukprot:TRINITY_DN7196_c0_g1_i1.p1 TRINITY_DN7196_c0_g1~~TRINITY_DN7196_c0_g1_i1.p1  ORF type:complete len:217 (-),score=46.17 TRINITY_DN7196_c0_g1_i1:208-858(-)
MCIRDSYCSVDCQKKDWKRKHGAECKAFSTYVEKEIERKRRDEDELEANINRLNQVQDPEERRKLQQALELKMVVEDARVTANINEMLNEWATPDVLEARKEAIRKNDPFVLVRYARNQRKPIRSRALAAEFACSMMWLTNQAEGNDQVMAEMQIFAVRAGLPSACLTQADECLEHNDIKGFEHYLEVAARNGSIEAIEKLREYRRVTNISNNNTK